MRIDLDEIGFELLKAAVYIIVVMGSGVDSNGMSPTHNLLVEKESAPAYLCM